MTDPTPTVVKTEPAAPQEPQRSVPFGRPLLGDAERNAVLAVLAQPVLTHGGVVREFEAAFRGFTAAPHAVATNSCTAALHLAFQHLGVGPGDEVVVPALTHVATAHAVELTGARCAFVDAEPATGNVDLEQLEGRLTARTRAVAVVHFAGLPVDMRRLDAITRPRGLPVVEDCALALGARLDGRHVGLFGDAGCFSFYPVKHVTTAEGGMLISRRGDLAAGAARGRAFGIDRNVVSERPAPGCYDVVGPGHNYRMNEISAALGVAQMKRLPGFLAQRRANYRRLAAGLAALDELRVLGAAEPPGAEHACYCLVAVLAGSPAGRRPALMAELRRRGVGVSIYYPRPVPDLTHYRRRYGFADNAFPAAARLCAASVALPAGPHLRPGDVEFIIASVKDAIVAVR